jgi:hypothetical protein
MPIQSSALQTPSTDTASPANLVGQVDNMDVFDATEAPAPGEKTAQLELGDAFNVVLGWKLTGVDTTIVGGYWLVSLYSSAMDGQGQMTGLLSSSPPIPVVGAPSPLPFSYTFNVAPGSAGPPPVAASAGLYKLTATINHSPTGNANDVSEMFGFAESSPIQITQVVDDSD